MANGTFNVGGQQLSPSGQSRVELARALLGQGASGAPVQSVTQGLNRLAQGFLGGRLNALQRGEEQERQQALADTLRRVTQAGQQGTVTGPGGGGTGEVATADQRIMDALSSNPQTAPMAAQLTLEQALRGPEQISASDLVEIQTPEGARFVPANMAVGQAPARDTGGNAVNVLLPGTDEPVSGIEDDQGRIFIRDSQGNRVRAPSGARKVGLNVQAESTAALGSTEARELRDAEAAAKNFIRTTEDAINLLAENPDVNTMVAKGAALVNDLEAEAKAFGRMFGEDMYEGDMGSLLNPDSYGSAFDQLGIENRRMRSLITSLGFQLARSREPGRLSDNEVRLAINDIGGSTGDPRAFARTLQDVAQRVGRRFQINFETRKGQPYEGDLGLSRLQGQGERVDLGDGVTLEFQ